MPSSLPLRNVYDSKPNVHGWKTPRGRPETRCAVQMVFDGPKWKANARIRAVPLSQVNNATYKIRTYTDRLDIPLNACSLIYCRRCNSFTNIFISSKNQAVSNNIKRCAISICFETKYIILNKKHTLNTKYYVKNNKYIVDKPIYYVLEHINTTSMNTISRYFIPYIYGSMGERIPSDTHIQSTLLFHQRLTVSSNVLCALVLKLYSNHHYMNNHSIP